MFPNNNQIKVVGKQSRAAVVDDLLLLAEPHAAIHHAPVLIHLAHQKAPGDYANELGEPKEVRKKEIPPNRLIPLFEKPMLRVPSIPILSRDPNRFRKPPETQKERPVFEKNDG